MTFTIVEKKTASFLLIFLMGYSCLLYISPCSKRCSGGPGEVYSGLVFIPQKDKIIEIRQLTEVRGLEHKGNSSAMRTKLMR